VVHKWPEYYRVECLCFSQASFFFDVMYVGKIFLSCHCNIKCRVDDNMHNFFWQGLMLYTKAIKILGTLFPLLVDCTPLDHNPIFVCYLDILCHKSHISAENYT